MRRVGKGGRVGSRGGRGIREWIVGERRGREIAMKRRN